MTTYTTTSTSRTYVKGWTSRVQTESRATVRYTGEGSARSGLRVAGSKVDEPQLKTYEEIKAHCLATGTKWEDPDFPTIDSSMFYSKAPSGWPNIQWKRPHEICPSPKMFVGGASRMDVVQGALGDCWLLAAVASLTTKETLLYKVVPPDQTFDKDYAGVFRFYFWQYGRWVEILVDDRLPYCVNKLVYMHSVDKSEFWSALIEKAYAKLATSYEALSGGQTSDALTDFTGGVVEWYDLGAKTPPYLFSLMLKAFKKGSLMGCSINSAVGEAEMQTGLIAGHAYSITDVRTITVKTDRAAGQIPMIRVRNPWGDSHEWLGAWSDSSPQWKMVPDEEKETLGLTFTHDGEFWMSYKDFSTHFQRLELCYLGPDSVALDAGAHGGHTKWEGNLHEGSWRPRVNAGGCIKNASFYRNPQYRVSVEDPDSDDDDGNGSIIVGVMQKERRKLKKEGKGNLSIGYAIFKLPDPNTGTLDGRFFARGNIVYQSPFNNIREVSKLHKLTPGHYVIVPSTFDPELDADFLLRLFSERKADQVHELDDQTHMTDAKTDMIGIKKDEDTADKQDGKEAFVSMAGEDGEIDAFELQEILNKIFLKHFKFDGFSTDMTRSMVAMKDADMTGKLGFADFKSLWTDLSLCMAVFMTQDKDNSGFFSSYELRNALDLLGFKVSNATFNAIVMRYSDKEGSVRFDDFVACYIKLKSMFDKFKAKDPAGDGVAKFSLDEYAMLAMYS